VCVCVCVCVCVYIYVYIGRLLSKHQFSTIPGELVSADTAEREVVAEVLRVTLQVPIECILLSVPPCFLAGT
jgi:hypothetical protein